MTGVRWSGACAALLAVASITPAQAQVGVDTVVAAPTAAAAIIWELRSGLNVAALACRGADEAAIVAGYNQLLSTRRAELAGVYQAVAKEHASPAAFDAAMTRLYNGFAQPAAQAALCDNALGVLQAMAAQADQPLTALAGTALAKLENRGPVVAQLAVASIPLILVQPAQPAAPAEAADDGLPDPQ